MSFAQCSRDCNQHPARVVRCRSGRGASDAEVQSRRSRFGENRLPAPPRESEIRRFLRQFHSPLVLVLIAAATVATVIGAMERSGSVLAVW